MRTSEHREYGEQLRSFLFVRLFAVFALFALFA